MLLTFAMAALICAWILLRGMGHERQLGVHRIQVKLEAEARAAAAAAATAEAAAVEAARQPRTASSPGALTAYFPGLRD